MNKLEQKIDSLSEKELINLIEETNDKYDNWNINLDKIVENLPNNSKIFLSDMVDEIGEKIFYIIYGYLNADSLIEYDEMTSGGITSFIQELDNKSTLNFIELIVDFKKQEIELVEDSVDFTKIISKLKREVATLKKKLAQPSKLINTKQFEERYGLTRVQQKGLRTKITDPLPYSMVNDKTIMYEPEEVEKWLENYKGRMKGI
jgi:hypothetical protein